MVNVASLVPHPLVFSVRKPHRREDALDDVGAPDVQPVRRGQVVEAEQRLFVACADIATASGYFSLKRVGLEQCGRPSAPLPYSLRSRCRGSSPWPVPACSWAACPARSRFMDPTALSPRCGEDLGQSFPESKAAVGDRQLRIDLQPPTLQLQQQLLPALLALPESVANGQQLLLPLVVGPNDHQDAGALILQAHVEVHPVSPQVGVLRGLQRPLAPLPRTPSPTPASSG